MRNKMGKEFNLSEKITNVVNLNNVDISSIPVKDIKEFIKLLKDKLETINGGNWTAIKYNIYKKIDKLAGDKLI